MIKRRRCTPAVIIEMHTTLAGVFQLRQYIQETVRDSFRLRKSLLKSKLTYLILPCSRGPMLEKTKMTNNKILKKKEYVPPEQLGDRVGKDTRAKKEDEAELRAALEK